MIIMITSSSSPEVVDTTERLLGLNDVEVDDGIHAHCYRVPGEDLVMIMVVMVLVMMLMLCW